MEEHYKSIAESIIQLSTPEIDIESFSSIDNFGRGIDAFSLYNSVYLKYRNPWNFPTHPLSSFSFVGNPFQVKNLTTTQ